MRRARTAAAREAGAGGRLDPASTGAARAGTAPPRRGAAPVHAWGNSIGPDGCRAVAGGGTASARREPRRAGGVVAARAYIPVRTRYRGHPWPLLRRLRPTTSSGCVGVVAPVMPVPTGEHPSSLVRGPPTKERVETPWHWLLLAIPSRRAKPRPQRRPRTSCPGGRAQVAQGCATTRVRTGRPVEGCALPPGHGGPVRSWHYGREYRLVGRSDTGAPGPQPQGFLPCARSCRASPSVFFAPTPGLPGPDCKAFGLAPGAAGSRGQGFLLQRRGWRAPIARLFALRPGLPGSAIAAFCSNAGAPGPQPQGLLPCDWAPWPRPTFRGRGFRAGTPPGAPDAAVRFEGGLPPMVWRFPPGAGAPARR